MINGSSPFPLRDFLLVSLAAVLVVVVLMATVYVVSRRTGRIVVVDTAWGLGFIAVALVSALLGAVLGGRLHGQDRDYGWTSYSPIDAHGGLDDALHDHALRSWGLFVLVAVWGGRLAWHIYSRSRGGAEDPRYEELMARGPGGIVRKVLLPQGLAIWFISLPVQLSAVLGGRIGVVAWIGVAVWLVGMVFESVGDAQLSAYKRDPDRGSVMDRGLWRYTRHPNYFGDACVWWGIWLVVADVWPGVLTVLSPVVMTYFLVFATGARLTEKTMMKRKGYPEYAARTSMFFPLPPKKGADPVS